MTTDEMKKIYEANPSDWLVVYKYSLSGKWGISNGMCWLSKSTYQLISVRHKEVLEAYLADNAVEIEVDYDNDCIDGHWEIEYDFIGTYNHIFAYQLKEKENGNMATSTICDGIVNMVSNEAINNFQDFGFTADFEGRIYEEYEGEFFGRVDDMPVTFSKEGIVFSTYGKELTSNFKNLAPIKKTWYEYPENYPAMLIRDTEDRVGYICADRKEQFIKLHRQGFRLITRAEIDALYCEED